LSNSVFVIQYNECSKLQASGKSYVSQIKNSFQWLALLGILLGLLFLILGPQLFRILLGEQHELSGQMARFLAFWFVIQFMVSPFSFTAILTKKQSTSLLLNSLDILIKIVSFTSGYYLNNLWIGIALYSLLSGITGICIYRWYLQISE
jgi:O-antigen/teichoic acid export membrane protein